MLLATGKVLILITQPWGPSSEVKGKVEEPNNPASAPVKLPHHTFKYLLVSHTSKPPVENDLMLTWSGVVLALLSIPVVSAPLGSLLAKTNFIGILPILAAISGGITPR